MQGGVVAAEKPRYKLTSASAPQVAEHRGTAERDFERSRAEGLQSQANDANASLAADDRAALKTAMDELEEMRAARRRQEEMVAAIVQQRDMYRSLLAQVPSSISLCVGCRQP